MAQQPPKFGYGTQGPAIGYTDKDAEIKRTMDVIKNRAGAGMGNQDQMTYYKKLTGQDFSFGPTVAKQPTINYQDQMTEMYNQQKGQIDNMFANQRNALTGSINNQKAKVAPKYQGLRNQSDVVNMQNVKRLREVMAANGLGSSGENVSANVSLNNARQNSLNSLNLQQQETLNDYDAQIAQITAQIEAQKAQALMNAYNRAQEIGYQRMRDSVSDNRYADETAYDRGRDTVGDTRYQKEWDYNVGRDVIGDQRYDKEWNYQVQQDKLANARRNNPGGGTPSSNDWANDVVNQFAKEQKQAFDSQMSRSSLGSYWYDRGNPRVATPTKTKSTRDRPFGNKPIPTWY